MIECENLVKIYKTKEIEVVALQGLDLRVGTGELMAIIGNSGSGKSTLLNMLGGLDTPSAGRLLVDKKELFKMNARELNRYRRETVGFIWQNNARNLIPYLSVLDNILMPMNTGHKTENLKWAKELIQSVGLSGRKEHKLMQLSGGEQQRVAIAIALANKPRLLLADEPTGSVDAHTAALILDLFRAFNRSLGITVVIVTHDLALSRKVDRIVSIRDGKVSSEFIAGNETHTEMAVMDKTGRLQLPQDYAEDIRRQGSDKLLVTKEGDRIILSLPK